MLAIFQNDLSNKIAAGIVFALLNVIFSLSFAAFIYSGILTPYFSIGYACILIGSAFVMATISYISSIPIAIGGAQDHSLPIYSIMTGSVATYLTTQQQFSAIFPSIIISISIATILTGIFFLIISSTKLIKFILFIPYPVIGGFLAGTGWLIFYGSLKIIFPHQNHIIPFIFELPALIHWLPALIYAVFLLLISPKIKQGGQLLALMLSAIVFFYLIKLIFQIPVLQLQQQEWLLPVANQVNFVNSISLLNFLSIFQVSWNLILHQIGNIGAIILISTLGILLNTTATEISLKKEINLKQELQGAGLGTFFSGLIGGVPGYIMLGNTVLNRQAQNHSIGNKRISGLIGAGLMIVAVFLTNNILVYVPRFFISGILMYLGLFFIKEWVYDARKFLPLVDYLIVVTILIIIIFVGIIPGIGAGILISIGIFLINYSKINNIKYTLSGDAVPFAKLYEPAAQNLLLKNGNQIFYYKLQNYLFFGNANYLFEDFKRIAQKSEELKYSIYSFQHVSGMDSSAVYNFGKIIEAAKKKNILIIFADLNQSIFKLMKKTHIFSQINSNCFFFENSNNALEWCEDDLLKKLNFVSLKKMPLKDQLFRFLEEENLDSRIIKFFERLDLKESQYLIHQGEFSNDLFYIESGELAIVHELKNRLPLHLRTIGAGNLVGEIALFIKSNRSASVIAKQNSILMKLTRENLIKMNQQDPHLSIAFHSFTIHILAERIIHANKQVSILSQ